MNKRQYGCWNNNYLCTNNWGKLNLIYTKKNPFLKALFQGNVKVLKMHSLIKKQKQYCTNTVHTSGNTLSHTLDPKLIQQTRKG